MADIHNLTIPASLGRRDLVLGIKLTGTRMFSARIWIAAWIFRLGGWVAGVTTHFEI